MSPASHHSCLVFLSTYFVEQILQNHNRVTRHIPERERQQQQQQPVISLPTRPLSGMYCFGDNAQCACSSHERLHLDQSWITTTNPSSGDSGLDIFVLSVIVLGTVAEIISRRESIPIQLLNLCDDTTKVFFYVICIPRKSTLQVLTKNSAFLSFSRVFEGEFSDIFTK